MVEKMDGKFDENKFDEKDWKVLEELRCDAKATTSKIAKRTGIPITTVHNRIKRMEQQGIITKYEPIIDFPKLGLGLHAMVFVTVGGKEDPDSMDQEELARKIKGVWGVEVVRILTGTFDLVLEVRVADVDELNTLLIKELRKIPGIDKTQTMLVLHEKK